MTMPKLDDLMRIARATQGRASVRTVDLAAAMTITDVPSGVVAAICRIPSAVREPSLVAALGHAARAASSDELPLEGPWSGPNVRRAAAMRDLARDWAGPIANAAASPRALLGTVARATGRYAIGPDGGLRDASDARVRDVAPALLDWMGRRIHFAEEGYRMPHTAFAGPAGDDRDEALAIAGLDLSVWRSLRRAVHEVPTEGRRRDILRVLDRLDARVAFAAGAVQNGREVAVEAARLLGVQAMTDGRSVALAIHNERSVPFAMRQPLIDSFAHWFALAFDDYRRALRSPSTSPMAHLVPSLPKAFLPRIAADHAATMRDLTGDEIAQGGIGVDAEDMLSILAQCPADPIETSMVDMVDAFRRDRAMLRR